MDVEEHYFALAASPDGEYLLFFFCGWGFTGFYTGAQVRPWSLALQLPRVPRRPGSLLPMMPVLLYPSSHKGSRDCSGMLSRHVYTACMGLAQPGRVRWARCAHSQCCYHQLALPRLMVRHCRAPLAYRPAIMGAIAPFLTGLLPLGAGLSCGAAGGRGCQLPGRAGRRRFGRPHPAPGGVLSAQLQQVPQHRLRATM